MATNLSYATMVRWHREQKRKKSSKLKATLFIVHTSLREASWTVTKEVVTAGIDAMPVRKSASAMLDKRMLECFCSSFL